MNHYRIGYNHLSKFATVFQIHGILEVGSKGHVNSACCYGYSPEEFVEDYLMYIHSIKLNMFLVKHLKNGMDAVTGDFPFTIEDWKLNFKEGELEIKNIKATQEGTFDKSTTITTFNPDDPNVFDGELAYSLHFIKDVTTGGCGIYFFDQEVVSGTKGKRMTQKARKYVLNLQLKKFTSFGLPFYILS